MAWSTINEQELVKKYQEDETISREKLVKQYNISPARVKRILERHGAKIRSARRIITTEEKQQFVQLYFDEGWTAVRIAKKFELCESAVRKVLESDERYEKRKYLFLSDGEKQAVLKEYLETSATHTEIAEKYGCTRSSVSRVIEEFEKGLAPKFNPIRKRLTVSAKTLIEELKRPGVTQRSLSIKYGVSESCIYHAIARYKGKKQ